MGRYARREHGLYRDRSRLGTVCKYNNGNNTVMQYRSKPVPLLRSGASQSEAQHSHVDNDVFFPTPLRPSSARVAVRVSLDARCTFRFFFFFILEFSTTNSFRVHSGVRSFVVSAGGVRYAGREKKNPRRYVTLLTIVAISRRRGRRMRVGRRGGRAYHCNLFTGVEKRFLVIDCKTGEKNCPLTFRPGSHGRRKNGRYGYPSRTNVSRDKTSVDILLFIILHWHPMDVLLL